MKRIVTLLAVVLLASASLGAQDLANLWRESIDDTFESLNGRSKQSIRDFASAYSAAHNSYSLAREIGQCVAGKKPRSDIEFILDTSNGYLKLEHTETLLFREAEMCYWNLVSGDQLFCVKFHDINEEEDPVIFLAFYGYDRDEGFYYRESVDGAEQMVDNLDIFDGNENLFLPRYGKDIKWGRNNSEDPIGWWHFQNTGDFYLEMVQPALLGCFLNDDSPIPFYDSPKGKPDVVLPNDEDFILEVCNPTDGYWQMFSIETIEGDELPQFVEDQQYWVHYSVLGIGTRNYVGEPINLREEPSVYSDSVGLITEETIVLPLDLSQDGKWVKVQWGELSGWLQDFWLCPNPVTTCP